MSESEADTWKVKAWFSLEDLLPMGAKTGAWLVETELPPEGEPPPPMALEQFIVLKVKQSEEQARAPPV